MKKNKNNVNLKLDAMTYLSDELVDKATKKRIEWLNARTKKKIRAFTIIPIAATLALIIAALSVILVLNKGKAPDGEPGGSTPPVITPVEKQIPVYTGMTVSGEAPTTSELMADPDGYVAIIEGHNGFEAIPVRELLAGTYRGKGGSIDHHKPFPEGQNNAVEKADSILNVSGTDKDIYYAKANEDVYITVHVNNPDKFEILSFTLNGTKYADYMFERGSDLENLILKVNVGSSGGVFEYTLDNIKYVDGTEIKDVRLEGDRTVKIGVYTDNLPTANISNKVISSYGITADLRISDIIGLIEASGGEVIAVIYDGNSILDYKKLSVGDNSISFSGLTPDTLYQLSVVAKYDRLDGNGVKTEALYQEAFYTNTVLSFESVDISNSGISFVYSWIDADNQGNILSSALYMGEEKIKDLNDTDTSIDGLLSGKTYRIVTVFSHDGKENTAVIEFTTEAKIEPTYSINDVTSDKTSIVFSIGETDADNIGAITEIKLAHANGTSFTKALSDNITFDGLLSNNDYTITVTYTYDPNDGTGVKTKTVTKTVKTKAKAEPKYTIGTPTVTQTSVSFGITESDIDSIGGVAKVELIDANGSALEKPFASNVEFTGLTSASKYTVRVTYSYDLNDGNGVQTKTVEKTVITPAKTITVTDIQLAGNGTVKAGESTSLTVFVDNPDNVEINSFVINGVSLRATKFGTNNYIVTYTSTSEGGKEALSCTGVGYNLFGTRNDQSAGYTDDTSLVVLGVVKLVSVTMKDNVNEYYVPNDTLVDFTVILKFEGSEGYTVESVRASTGNTVYDGRTFTLTKIDDTTYSMTFNDRFSLYEYYDQLDTVYASVRSFTYGIDGSTTTTELTKAVTATAYVYSDSITYVDISTPEELLAYAQSNKESRVRLTQDIDMAGYTWIPLKCSDFNGNGYKIKNLTLSAVDPTGVVRLILGGPPAGDNGVIRNVTFENLNVSVKGKEMSLIGGGEGRSCYIYNVHIEGNVTMVGATTYGSWRLLNSSNTDNCSFTGTIEVSDFNQIRELTKGFTKVDLKDK